MNPKDTKEKTNEEASNTIIAASRKKQTTIFPKKKLVSRKEIKTNEKPVEKEKKLDMAKEPSKEEESNSSDE